MTLLNERYDYGLELCLLSIDEGISGYRDASLDVSTSLLPPPHLSSSTANIAPGQAALVSFLQAHSIAPSFIFGPQTVKRNAVQYGLPLKILSYQELYGGWTMDKVVAEVGKKGNCTYCGVFRRQALDRGAHLLEVDHVVTGHNADDVAETVLMNGEPPPLTIRHALSLKLSTDHALFSLSQSYAATSPASNGARPSPPAGTPPPPPRRTPRPTTRS